MSYSDLAAWLRTTITAEKSTAERATAGRWAVAVDARGRWRVDVARWNDYLTDYEVTGRIVRPRNFRDAEHIALHDPRDTIARCEADLELIDGLAQVADGAETYGGTAAWLAEDLLEDVAQGYRHRSGFKPEWNRDAARAAVSVSPVVQASGHPDSCDHPPAPATAPPVRDPAITPDHRNEAT